MERTAWSLELGACAAEEIVEHRRLPEDKEPRASDECGGTVQDARPRIKRARERFVDSWQRLHPEFVADAVGFVLCHVVDEDRLTGLGDGSEALEVREVLLADVFLSTPAVRQREVAAVQRADVDRVPAGLRAEVLLVVAQEVAGAVGPFGGSEYSIPIMRGSIIPK